MTKQQLARIRNWSKMRLLGGSIPSTEALSDYEKTLIGEIKERMALIDKHWDENTCKLGLTPGKRYMVYHPDFNTPRLVTKDAINLYKKDGLTNIVEYIYDTVNNEYVYNRRLKLKKWK